MKGTALLILVIAFVALTANVTLGASVDSVDILIKALVNKGIITEDDAAGVRAEIANIRQDEETTKKSFSVSAKRPIKLSGYIQERYTGSNLQGFNDTFETKRARLTLAGDATDKVDFKLQVDFAGSKSALTGATLTPNADPLKDTLATKSANLGKPTLLDAIWGYKLSAEQKLSIGQFKIPFGLENLTSSNALDTINRSLVTESLVPGRDNGSQGRSVGAQFSSLMLNSGGWARGLTEYYVGVFDGSGTNAPDDNSRKDPAVRVVWQPGVTGLQLAGEYYNGVAGASSKGLIHNRNGGSLAYQYGPWSLKSEYIWGRDGNVNKSGWYGILLRQLNSNTQAVVRFDTLNANTAVQNDPISTWTFGFNKFLNKDGYTRWQVNYESRRAPDPSIRQDQVIAQYQAGF